MNCPHCGNPLALHPMTFKTKFGVLHCSGILKDDECTGVAARWCPVHGDCTNRDWLSQNDEEIEDRWSDHCSDRDCPLHGEHSTHRESRRPPTELTNAQVDEIAREIAALAGAGDPNHPKLLKDIRNAHYVATYSAIFRGLIP